MTKKKKKHLQFYIDCINNDYVMPQFGLCSCAWAGCIDGVILLQFKPDHASNFDYWAGKGSTYKAQDKFTPLRQTIVLFMAAINNEL